MCGVIGNVRLGIKEQEALLQRFDELALQMGEPDADFDKLLEEQAELQVRESKIAPTAEPTRCDGQTESEPVVNCDYCLWKVISGLYSHRC